jgi:hypothetical protein
MNSPVIHRLVSMAPLSTAMLCTLLLGAGCSRQFATSCPREPFIGSDPVVTNFLEQPPIGYSHIGGKVFASYEVFGESRSGKTTTEYIWAVITEYNLGPRSPFPPSGGRYTEDGKLSEGFGESLPLAIQIARDGQTEKVVGHQEPRDGDLYGKDIVKIFPWCVRGKMYPVTSLNLFFDQYDPQPLPQDSVMYMNKIYDSLRVKNDQAAEMYFFSTGGSGKSVP